MKKIEMSDDTKDGLLLKVKMRQETGIDPAAINSEMKTLQQFVQTISDMAQRFEDEHLCPEKSWLNPFAGFISVYRKGLHDLKDEVTRFLAATYQNKYLPNLGLPLDAFLNLMHEKMGDDKYDAEMIGSRMREIMKKGRELSFEQILRQAQNLLPWFEQNTTPEARIETILKGKRLYLHAWLEKLNEKLSATAGGNRTILPPEYYERVVAIEKFSRILIDNEDPTNVQARLCELLPSGYVSAENMLQKRCPGKPIASIQLHFNGSFVIEYETPEQARKIAETLLNDKEALAKYTQTAPRNTPRTLQDMHLNQEGGERIEE